MACFWPGPTAPPSPLASRVPAPALWLLRASTSTKITKNDSLTIDVFLGILEHAMDVLACRVMALEIGAKKKGDMTAAAEWECRTPSFDTLARPRK